jgi:hypothetical protein
MQIEPGQLAVLTGGGTGIGRALARQLAAAGAHVAMCDVSEANMAESRAQALAGAPAGTRITTHLADISQEAQVLAFRDAVVAQHGVNYAEERDKRLRPDGNAQYLPPRLRASWPTTWTTPTRRGRPSARAEDRPRALRLHRRRLRRPGDRRPAGEAGIDDVRIIEKGGDFGGTWYWNRYPARSATPRRFVYMPLLEETGHMPTEKYAHAPEILEHCQRIGKQFGLYDDALFHTEVTDLAGTRPPVWVIEHQPRRRVHRPVRRHGHRAAARAQAARHPRHRVVRGHSFHTSRWDYDYTGGDPRARRWTSWPTSGWPSSAPAPPPCSACRTWPAPPASSTCSSARRRRSTCAPTAHRPRVVRVHRHARLAAALAGELHRQPDRRHRRGGPGAGRLDRPGPPHPRPDHGSCRPTSGTPRRCWPPSRTADFEKMEEIRARVDAMVQDPGHRREAQGLVPPAVQAALLPRRVPAGLQPPNVTLVDTDGKGVERITETGVVVAGVEYEVDCIIYASGFEVGTEYTERAGFDLTAAAACAVGALGRRDAHQARHPRARVPQPFVVQPTQGANLISNVPHNLTEAAAPSRDRPPRPRRGRTAWSRSPPRPRTPGSTCCCPGPGHDARVPDCTPGYYNNEGQGVALCGGPSRRRQRLLPVPERLARVGALRGPGLQLTWRSRPSQYGARSARRRILPVGLRGSSVDHVDALGHLEAGDALTRPGDHAGRVDGLARAWARTPPSPPRPRCRRARRSRPRRPRRGGRRSRFRPRPGRRSRRR